MNLKSIIYQEAHLPNIFMKLSHPASIWIIHWECLVLPNKTSPLLTQEPQEGKSALLRHPVSYNIEKYFLQNFFFLGGLDGVQRCFVPFRLGERQKERREREDKKERDEGVVKQKLADKTSWLKSHNILGKK